MRVARESTIVELRFARFQNFGAKGPKIVASYAPEPCRSFVFGPKPYAQHPFDFELAPSTTISGAVWRPPHKRESCELCELLGL